MNEATKILLTKLRPQLIPIVEGFGFKDTVLNSAIGNSYGDIYETHLEWAKTSRLNDDKGSIPDGFMEYIMPILKGKLWFMEIKESILTSLYISRMKIYVELLSLNIFKQ